MRWFSLFLILVLALVIYANSLGNGFVYDDYQIIKDNVFIHNLANVKFLFSKTYLELFGEHSYRPLITLSYFLDCVIWKKLALGFHLTNLILHLLNIIVVFFLIYRLSKDEQVASITAAFFAAHPVMSEAVNGIWAREDALCALFYLGALLLYLKRKHALSMVCFAAALFSKEMAITFPAIVFLNEFFLEKENDFQLKKVFAKIKKILIACTGILAVYLLLRFVLIASPQVPEKFSTEKSLYSTLLTMQVIILGYLKVLFYPVKLCVDYVVIPFTSFFNFWVIDAFLVNISILFLAWLKKRQWPLFSFSVFFFYATLIPVYDIFPISNPMAERYLYLPALGFYVMLAMAFSFCFKRGFIFSKAALFFFLTIVFSFSLNVIERNKIWKDDFSFWQATLEDNPRSVRALSGLAVLYFNNGYFDKAVSLQKQAIKFAPATACLYSELGSFYYDTKDYKTAEKYYKKALVIEPENSEAHFNLGLYHMNAGEYAQAAKEFNAVLARNRFDYEAMNNLGVCFLKIGKYDKACEKFRQALRLNPLDNVSRNNLKLLKERFPAAK